MFKLNNKGFAFSTILYGLMLMGVMIIIVIMSIMQTNRITDKRFVENIEKELNRFSLTESNFNANSLNEGQEYIVPMGQSGWYKIELWGAQGGGSSDDVGGLGAYTSGLIWLKENTHLYFYVGKRGNSFNGGGSKTGSGFAGGGATDVRLVSGQWNNDASRNSRIMVAAGGGGGAGGGAGGAIIGTNGTGTNALGGKQNGDAGHFGFGSAGSGSNASGGGGGYYGGNGSSGAGSGGGGSSYISGYAGVYTRSRSGADATLYNVTTDQKNYTLGYFINGVMIAGVKNGDGAARIEKMGSTVVDVNALHTPLIQADITPPPSLHTNLDRVRYVRDCITGSREDNTSTVNNNHWSEIQVIQNGRNIANNKNYLYTNGNGNWSGGGSPSGQLTDDILSGSNGLSKSDKNDKCVIVNLGSIQKVDEIAVWHNFNDAKQNTINHRVSVSDNGSTWTDLATPATVSNASLESYETSNGFHYSRWQPVSKDTLADGTYYIMSAASDNLFVTADQITPSVTSPTLNYKRFTGEANQQWNVRSIGDNKYIITTVQGGYPLQVCNGTYYDNSPICIRQSNGANSWEQFYITNNAMGNIAGNNTYYIYANVFINIDIAHAQEDGYIYMGAAYDPAKYYNNINPTVTGKSFVANGSAVADSLKNRMMRFKLISVNH